MSRARQMRELLARWETSGLTQKAFAKRERIAYSTLLYWRRRLAGRGSRVPGRPSEPAFASVRVVPDRPREAAP